jgi:sugar fermentation stimulation protein A
MLFSDLVNGQFINRPNRFVVECIIDGKTCRASLPNSGRLRELLLPGVPLLLQSCSGRNIKLPYKAVAAIRNNSAVMLDTIKNNAVTRYLLENKYIPGLKDARIARDGVKYFIISMTRKTIMVRSNSIIFDTVPKIF